MSALPSSLAHEWPDALVLTDARGVIEYVNPAFERLTGFRSREVLGRTPAVLKSGKLNSQFYRRMWRKLLRGRPFRGVFVNRRKGGGLFHEEELIRPLRGPDGRIAHFLSAGRDITAQMREVEKLQHSATHDTLTGLPNRALYADRLAHALRMADRRNEGAVVAMMDLDGFKEVNTRYGHLAGDAVLRAVARRTLRCVRAIDTVARVGGDEFALVLAGIGSLVAARKVLEKVRSANAARVRYGRRAIAMTVSIGASRYPRDGSRDVTLRKRADVAMYEAKNAGGNRVRFA